MSHTRNLRITVALSAAVAAAAFTPAAGATTVCNEAGNGHRGDLVAQGTPDPSPPARYKDGLGALGNGKGAGLQRAAERSPALSQCGPPTNDQPGSSGGDLT
jgi:hypothetical protein